MALGSNETDDVSTSAIQYTMQHILLYFQRRKQVLPSNIYFVIRFKNKLNTLGNKMQLTYN